MTFYDSRSYDPTIEQLVGTPEEIMSDAGQIPLDVLPPLRILIARCDVCNAHSEIARTRYADELIELPDGTRTSLADWPNNGYGDWRRRWRFKASCRECGLTSHMPWGWR